MVVNIIDPQYWISELFGDVLVFAIFLTLLILFIASKQKLPFQTIAPIFVLSFLLLGLIFEGFVSWIPLILVIVGIMVGPIFYRFLERT